jgi:acetolactate synthase-1/2/3 large subunit
MVKKIKLSGEKAIARALKECGIEYFFYVTGGMGTLFPVIENEKINMILCRNEKAACNMADGYSRVTNKPSVCYGQHGAGAAIIASMLYESMFAHSPVVALTGSTPTSDKHQWRYQEVYEMKFFEETCKFNVDVTDVSRLAEYIRTAIQISVSGCPGPTHVNMHLDMSRKIAEMPEIYGDSTFFKVPPFRPRAEPDKVAEAVNLLISAERPVMVCGAGVHISVAYNEIRELSELLTIPVATNYKGFGCYPEGHPLNLGVMGNYGKTVVNEYIRKADLVFFVSTRAGSHMTAEFTAPEPGSSKIIHLDIDPLVIGRNYKTDVALVGDAQVTLREILSILKNKLIKNNFKEQRLKEISKALTEYQSIVNPLMNSDAIPIKPQRIMKELSKFLRTRDIVVSDTGQMICWTTRLLKLKGAGLTYIPVGGTLGSSFAIAIGASFGAEEGQRVLNLIGDGGITYNIAELETAKRYNDRHEPFVALVNNNSSLGQTRSRVEDWSKEEAPWISCSDFTELDYAKIARAFGCYGVRVERPGEIVEALEEAYDSGKPAIVDVVTDKREYAPLGLIRTNQIEYEKRFSKTPIY